MSGLKLKVVPQFPARVIGGPGIDVTKSNGTFSIDLNYAEFPQVSVVPATPTYALIFDPVTGKYVQCPVSLLGGGSGSGGISDAPIDGTTYGRNSAAWTHVLDLSGGTLTGPLVLAGDPTALLGAATKQYVDAHTSGGSGDVVGPAGAAADSIAVFNGTTGKLIKDGGKTIAQLTVTPSPLTKTDDTNVTLTLGGTPASALLQATSITVGWTGTLSAARGGFGMNVSAQNGVPLFAAGVPTFTGTTGTGSVVLSADPVFTGNPTAPTPSPGDNDQSIATTAFVATAIASVGGSPTAHGRCHFDYVSATQVKLSPFDGDQIMIAGTQYHIAAAGVTGANTGVYVNGVAGQNLAANTVYNVYLFSNAGTLTLDFSTTAHTTDSTTGNNGIQIKSADNTRTLVGKVETNASSQFAANVVISWFNRRANNVKQTDGADRNVSTIWTEIVSTIRCRFLTWGDTVVRVSYCACLKGNAAGNAMYIGAGLDGVTNVFAGQAAGEPTIGYYVTVSGTLSQLVPEGVHYFTLVGGAAAAVATTTFTGTNVPSALEVEYFG